MNSQNFLESGLSTQGAAQVLLSDLPSPQRQGEPLRHILLGSPAAIRQTIHLLHNLRYVETVQWSPLVEIPNNQLIITPRVGEVMSLLVKYL
jgi:hypothetical protein